MDEIKLLRSVYDERLEPDDHTLIRARARLERELHARTVERRTHALGNAASVGGRRRATSAERPAAPRSRVRRAGLRAAALGVGAVAAAGIGVVAVDALLPAGPTSAAHASEILTLASERVLFEEPALAPGQYLRVTEESTTLTTVAAGSEEANAPGAEGDPPLVNFLQSGTLTTFVPADRGADWVVRRGTTEVVGLFETPGLPQADARRIAEASAADGRELLPAGEELWPGGRPAPSPDDLRNPDAAAPPNSAERLEEAPLDPEALRSYIERDLGSPDTSVDEAVFEWLRPVVTDATLPADARAAGFEVLAGLEGAEIAETELSFGGERGVSVAFSAREGEREELVFDPETGRLLGSRTVVTSDEAIPGVPAGTAIAETVISHEVVEGVPPLAG